jgi:5-methylcytosine-specific restriction endonuclease McrBC regulatory subunit McrC
LTPSHPDRIRQHESPHIRHTDQQILDALLRIEEVFEKFRVDFLRTRREQMIEETAKPAAKPAARKNPREL